MIISKKTFAFLAIFLILASMSVISAEDNQTFNTPPQNDVEEGGVPSDGGTADSGNLKDAEADDNSADEEIDDDNPYHHGALTPNEKAFLEDSQHAAGGEEKSISASGSPTTGNPILVLLATIAVLGIYPLRRK